MLKIYILLIIQKLLILVKYIKDDQLIIAESGIHNSNDVKTMNACGINTFLVGESLMTAKNPKDKFKEIFIS